MMIPHIENAFENVKTACQQKVKELYPHGVPAPVQERLEKELELLEKSEYADDFEIFRVLSKEAYKSGHLIIVRGELGGSFLIYLLSHGRFNPLPTHYYCSNCGFFEMVETKLFGIDLPETICPNCGTSILGDGFYLPIESVFGLDGSKRISFDFDVCEEFMPFAQRALEKLYPNNVVAPCGLARLNSNPESEYYENDYQVVPAGYFVLPTGQTENDYPDMITYFEDGEPCLSYTASFTEKYPMKKIRLLSSSNLENMVSLQRKTGIYTTEIGIKELREISANDIKNTRFLNGVAEYFFMEEKPKTLYDMVNYQALTYATFAHIENNSPYERYREIKKKIIGTAEYNEYPCHTREDYFEFLIESGLSKKVAFDLTENIRKGRASRPGFDTSSMPKALAKMAENVLYNFPRAHCIEFTILDARFAHYMKINSRIFSNIVFKNKK